MRDRECGSAKYRTTKALQLQRWGIRAPSELHSIAACTFGKGIEKAHCCNPAFQSSLQSLSPQAARTAASNGKEKKSLAHHHFSLPEA